jgi:predicted nucleic acid-binding protein
MIAVVDTNILLDIFLPDEKFSSTSAMLLKKAFDQGALIISEMVYAELVPQFKERDQLDRVLKALNISLSVLDRESAYLAGKKWALYRQAGGKRDRIITDFLIGAHALVKGDRFLTRDRGFYRTYFPELVLMQ